MITPMMKYTFLLHHAERERLLEELGRTAIVDITVATWVADDSDKVMLTEISRTQQVTEKLKSYIAINKESDSTTGKDFTSSRDIVDFFESSIARMDQLVPLLQKLKKEQQELQEWGDFDVSLVEKLAAEGLYFHYYTISESKFNKDWESEYNLTICNSGSKQLNFVVVSDDEKPFELAGARWEKPLTMSVADKNLELEKAESEANSIKSELLSLEAKLPVVEEYLEELKEGLSKRKVLQTNVLAADGQIVVIEGWSPIHKCDELDSLFEDNNSVVVVKERFIEGDNPPILLKNNKFARLSEIVTRLYSMPKYTEQDLTPFFAPFFIFFVGVCMGDMGYGLLIFVAALIARFKLKDSGARDIVSLVMWCCLATVIMGGVTGTFFGLSLAKYDMFSGVPFLGQMDMFTFSLVVGVIQILYAMIVKAIFEIKSKGLKWAVSTLSWAATIITTCVAYMGESMGIPFSMDSPIYMGLVALFLILYILFINPEKKNLLANTGGGLWALYNALTGMLGDTLSYIRLFALGLSSGIIAGVFNDLAIAMSGDIPVLKYVIMLIILLLGHSINLFMSAISSFVHPLRLTLVEFYKCAGFEGGGRNYNPFRISRKVIK